jgi:ribonuclease HII
VGLAVVRDVGRGDAMVVLPERHPGYTPRSAAGLIGYERVLARAGLSPVAGIDEAGRGACAGPLVVAAVAFEPRRLPGLHGIADSKALTAKAREKAYDEVVVTALAWHAVIIPSTEIDQLGLHVCNIAGMRRALAGLACQPAYVLTDGFAVRGLGVPALAMWKGDEVAACVAAASVVAKVTRDRIMRDLHLRYPEYGFARHKGYSTPAHMKALRAHGPCPEHRYSFVNVGGVACGDRALREPGGGLGPGPGGGLGPGLGGDVGLGPGDGMWLGPDGDMGFGPGGGAGFGLHGGAADGSGPGLRDGRDLGLRDGPDLGLRDGTGFGPAGAPEREAAWSDDGQEN